MASATISSSARGVELKVSDLLPTEGDVLFAMQRVRTRKLLNMSQGLDAHGQPFADYSPAYARQREKSGRNSSPVDLTWTGRLRNSMQVQADSLRLAPGAAEERIGLNDFRQKATQGRVGIYDSDAADKANWLQGPDRHKGMPQRVFLDGTDNDSEQVARDIEERVTTRARRKYGV